MQIKYVGMGESSRGPFGGALFDVSYPDVLKKRIEDIEYGTQDTPPNPAIRSFLNRLDDREETFEDSLAETFLHIMNLEEIL